LVSLIPAPAAPDPWVQQAIIAAEQAITELVNEFLDHPYMHRVEHSIHARLYGLLAKQSIFADPVALGSTGQQTQVLHKEWPETIASPDSPRGLFDLAILAPQQLERASLRHFRQGRIEAPIVIEIGLDYGFQHLDEDHTKVLESKVAAPYLIHLSRIRVRDEEQTEKLICNATRPVRTAYVHRPAKGAPAFKHLGEEGISTRRGE
jgi:hypothetical protein